MGEIPDEHTPVTSVGMRCRRHHHLQRRGSLGSLEVQAVLRCLLSCLGLGWFLRGPDPDAAEVRMARQLCGLDQSLDHVYHHGCRCAL